MGIQIGHTPIRTHVTLLASLVNVLFGCMNVGIPIWYISLLVMSLFGVCVWGGGVVVVVPQPQRLPEETHQPDIQNLIARLPDLGTGLDTRLDGIISGCVSVSVGHAMLWHVLRWHRYYHRCGGGVQA